MQANCSTKAHSSQRSVPWEAFPAGEERQKQQHTAFREVTGVVLQMVSHYFSFLSSQLTSHLQLWVHSQRQKPNRKVQ
jgi:hypothetical protein